MPIEIDLALVAQQRIRHELSQKPRHRFISSSEYSDLIISRHTLERRDHPHAALKGLHNLRTGDIFLIEAEHVPSSR